MVRFFVVDSSRWCYRRAAEDFNVQRIVLILALVAVFASTAPASQNARVWRSGRLVAFNDEGWTSSTTSPVRCNGDGTNVYCNGGQQFNWKHVTFYARIQDGDKTYFASRTLSWRWQRSPKVTENTIVKYAIEGDRLFLLDDTGREFKMDLDKERKNSPAEKREECAQVLDELLLAPPAGPAVAEHLAKMNGFEIRDFALKQLECETAMMQFRDFEMLGRYEAIRIAILQDLAGRLSPGKVVENASCDEVAATPATGVADLPLPRLVAIARGAATCARTQYDPAKPDWWIAGADIRVAAENSLGAKVMQAFVETPRAKN